MERNTRAIALPQSPPPSLACAISETETSSVGASESADLYQLNVPSKSSIVDSSYLSCAEQSTGKFFRVGYVWQPAPPPKARSQAPAATKRVAYLMTSSPPKRRDQRQDTLVGVDVGGDHRRGPRGGGDRPRPDGRSRMQGR